MVLTAAKESSVGMYQEARPASEDALVSRLRAGHEAAADELVALYADRLLRAASLLLNDRHLAEDAVQETLLATVTRIGQFRGESSLYSWMYAILMRWCRRQHRGRKIDSRLTLLPSEELANVAGEDTSVEAKWDSAQRTLHVSRAVGALPQAYREVVVLFYLEEFSIAEISRVIGKPEGTIKSLLHRARRKLAQTLEGDES
jgi:RNA polymerase sigma-70 factor (ECF subfamily)